MFPGPVVLIDDRLAAMAAVERGRPVTLLSPPDAAATLGPLGGRARREAAREAATAPMADILDCGAAPGYAMAALRCGCLFLVLGPCPAWHAVAAAAATTGAVVLDSRPPAMTILDWHRT
jgi:hypothetical protein